MEKLASDSEPNLFFDTVIIITPHALILIYLI